MRAATVASVGTGRSRHGAVIVKGGSVYGIGINKTRTHNAWVTGQPRELCSTHAEVSAIRVSGELCVRGSTLYVARVNRSGIMRDSKPCGACRLYIEDHGIRKVVHS